MKNIVIFAVPFRRGFINKVQLLIVDSITNFNMSEEIIENPALENAGEFEEQVIVKPATKKSNASVDNDKFDCDAFENEGFDT